MVKIERKKVIENKNNCRFCGIYTNKYYFTSDFKTRKYVCSSCVELLRTILRNMTQPQIEFERLLRRIYDIEGFDHKIPIL